MNKITLISALFVGLLILSGTGCTNRNKARHASFSGIYPHLANYNNENECGTGAVVPWAGKLWVISYGPHLPFGSSDKLVEIDNKLNRTIRKESIGGTPANRMIHRESDQLFIGPYVIDREANVGVIPYNIMPGRLTGNARHLTDPEGKLYYATMEEGFYEVDVKSLQPSLIYEDGNVKNSKSKDEAANQPTALLPGVHGKGLYSGQGVLVYSNNGEAGNDALTKPDIESGSLSEWDGKVWRLIRRNQFTEVTGPGGIYGNSNPATDPIWATGWDYKSVILAVRDNGKWSFFRLPKASHSYDGAHGWNTEWPRIRDVGTPENPEYLMTMHGLFWHFPGTFSGSNTSGIRPRSAYLKVIGDFARWNDMLVFGCDDAAKSEFLNKRKVKGNIAGAGQSNSNLWFTSPDTPSNLGPANAEGAVWQSEIVKENEISEPFLFAGWDIRSAWIKNEGSGSVSFRFETDKKGNNNWNLLKTVLVKPGQSELLQFTMEDKGEWIRVVSEKETRATVHFSYVQKDDRRVKPDLVFSGLAEITQKKAKAALLWPLDNNRRKLGVLAGIANDSVFSETGYYELDSAMNLIRVNDTATASYIRKQVSIPRNVITINDASVLIVDDRGRRWRLPKGDPKYSILTDNALLRLSREAVTERDLFSCSGTFYELPAENADGFAKIRPVASHRFRIHDYASYRGMLIISGIDPEAVPDNKQLITSDDGKASIWAGTIDDLWKLGKPTGEGGPWYNSNVVAGVASDPYLIGFYDTRNLTLLHDSNEAVTFSVEADPVGNGSWMKYKTFVVRPGEKTEFIFPESFQSRWIRLIPDKNCVATAWLIYN
jgi:hypothetical protein